MMMVIMTTLRTSLTPADEVDTRSRILQAAQRVFRKRGYHATGLSDILELAKAPKGSMYHHFPGGKEAIGVCVIEEIARALLMMLSQSRARSTEAMVLQVGEQLSAVMEKTHYEICALFSAFAAERATSPRLGEAVAHAYEEMIKVVQARLQADGFSTRLAKDTATMVVALLEGGSLLSQAQQNISAFRLSMKHASTLCKLQTKQAGSASPRPSGSAA
jgi:TetR/AcrR family transcriptional regulator, lmrAB and yxaGH operons repressor